ATQYYITSSHQASVAERPATLEPAFGLSCPSKLFSKRATGSRRRPRRGVEHGDAVRHVFGAIFFASVGMLINPHLLPSHSPPLALLAVVAVAGKLVSVSLASMLVGEPPNGAVKTRFSMAQVGMYSILFAQVDTDGGGTGGLLYSLAVGLTAITSVLCPVMIRASIPAADWTERHLPMPVQTALSQYGAWLHRIRKSPEPEDAERHKTGQSPPKVLT